MRMVYLTLLIISAVISLISLPFWLMEKQREQERHARQLEAAREEHARYQAHQAYQAEMARQAWLRQQVGQDPQQQQSLQGNGYYDPNFRPPEPPQRWS